MNRYDDVDFGNFDASVVDAHFDHDHDHHHLPENRTHYHEPSSVCDVVSGAEDGSVNANANSDGSGLRVLR